MIPMLLLWAAALEQQPVPLEEIPTPPSLELLEFLGRYEDAQGGWMDPMLLESFRVTENEDGDEQHHDEADADKVDPDSADDHVRR